MLLIVTTLITAAVISRFETAYTGRQGHMVYMSALYLCFATTSTIVGEDAPYSPLSRYHLRYAPHAAIFSLLIGEASEVEPPAVVGGGARARAAERGRGQRTPLLDDDRLGAGKAPRTATGGRPGWAGSSPPARFAPARGLSCPVLGRRTKSRSVRRRDGRKFSKPALCSGFI